MSDAPDDLGALPPPPPPLDPDAPAASNAPDTPDALPPPPPPTPQRVRGLVRAGLVLVVLGGVVVFVGLGDDPLGEGAARAVVPEALAAAGCTEVAVGDIDDRDHLDPATAPPAEELYDGALPAGGQHYGRTSPLVEGLPASALDPRAVVHNMEHGAIVVWVDTDRLGGDVLRQVATWRDQLGAAGYDQARTGAGIFISPLPDWARPTGPVALRAWGVAVDCPVWEVAAADAFVATHYGTRGAAPEADLGPYPSGNGVLVGPPGADEEVTTA